MLIAEAAEGDADGTVSFGKLGEALMDGVGEDGPEVFVGGGVERVGGDQEHFVILDPVKVKVQVGDGEGIVSSMKAGQGARPTGSRMVCMTGQPGLPLCISLVMAWLLVRNAPHN